MPRIKLSNGEIISVSDNPTPEELSAIEQIENNLAKNKQAQPVPQGDNTNAMTLGAIDSYMFGAPEYIDRKVFGGKRFTPLKEQFPVSYFAGEMAGAFAPSPLDFLTSGLSYGAKIARVAPRATKIARGVAEGGLTSGFASDFDPKSTSVGVALGGALGNFSNALAGVKNWLERSRNRSALMATGANKPFVKKMLSDISDKTVVPDLERLAYEKGYYKGSPEESMVKISKTIDDLQKEENSLTKMINRLERRTGQFFGFTPLDIIKKTGSQERPGQLFRRGIELTPDKLGSMHLTAPRGIDSQKAVDRAFQNIDKSTISKETMKGMKAEPDFEKMVLPQYFYDKPIPFQASVAAKRNAQSAFQKEDSSDFIEKTKALSNILRKETEKALAENLKKAPIPQDVAARISSRYPEVTRGEYLNLLMKDVAGARQTPALVEGMSNRQAMEAVFGATKGNVPINPISQFVGSKYHRAMVPTKSAMTKLTRRVPMKILSKFQEQEDQ